VSNEEIDQIAQRSWAVVLPYRDGTQSGVIPVAYYSACPVIVSDVGSLPELVTSETGMVVPPNDAARLAEAMLSWMDSERRREAGQAAFRFYKKHLIWDNIVVEFLQHLFGPVSSKRR
jgi:glycosyltransferase involved in cell wall biosynthesis